MNERGDFEKEFLDVTYLEWSERGNKYIPKTNMAKYGNAVLAIAERQNCRLAGWKAATAKADARIKELEVLLPPKLNETLTHERNCPAWHDAFGLEADAENCTCGYKWRVYLQTEQQMHNAWRKRAEEAEIKIKAAPPIPADKVLIPDELFDGNAVFNEIPNKAEIQASHVSDVLDAVVRLIRKRTPIPDDKVMVPILNELKKATKKFPTWPTDPLHALAVLGEEFGELTKAMLQWTYEPHKTNPEEIRTEAIQTAAMAIRLFMSLDVYKYNQCEQHSHAAKEG